METPKVQSLIAEIQRLSEAERQALRCGGSRIGLSPSARVGENGLCYLEGDGMEGRSPMDTAKVRSLVREILALPEPERQQLAREVLPALLATRAGLEEIDEALRELSDDELRALVERARRRASDLSQDEVAAIIAEGLRAARAQGRP